MKRKFKNVLITGGAGFIGSAVVRHFVKKYPEYHIYNLDALTYAGNLENLKSIETAENYSFLKRDITDFKKLAAIFNQYEFDGVIHLAAESHVDRSIKDPLAFAKTNILGTLNLLNCCRETWKKADQNKLFYQISTDEVYGSLGTSGLFSEKTPYQPNSPYSASKAAADHFVRAYKKTFHLPTIISNCSNNYGPYQFPEKLIPLSINNILSRRKLPIYGKGENIRDWLYVEDHVSAIDLIFHKGKVGETYNVGGLNEWRNIDLIKQLCKIMDKKLGRTEGASESLVSYVKDRPGHDLRYAINASKLRKDLGWTPKFSFKMGLEKTVDWYLKHRDWLENVINLNYQNYYKQQYTKD